ncbi:MAG: helix-hairpin-helix domain-containing protein [Erysipelotrichaceae bacterium]|nr:helix-hairpin-helix domain-containing protein [Erysipelotrichaceae bacterium]
MMLRRFILLLFLILSIVFLSGKIQKEPLKPTETIYVEIRGCIRKPGIYEMKLGSDLNGLFQIAELSDNADISAFLLNSKLYNDQLIIVPETEGEKKVSINSADIQELCSLPGIGPKTAQKIIDYRIRSGTVFTVPAF